MATKKHSWNYGNVGGTTRVRIKTGADIAHLGELDLKKWTVLSCPTVGLDIDEVSLKYIDADCDGRIRVDDVISTSQWLTSVVNDADSLVKGDDRIDIQAFNQENSDGKKLYNSAKQIIVNLGKEGNVISLADTKDIAAIFAKTRFNGDGVISENTPENAEEKAVVSARELESCLRESLDNLRLCGTITYLDCHCGEQAGIQQIIAVYDLFEEVTEMMLGRMTAMMVTATQQNGSIQLRMQVGCKEPLPELPQWSLTGGTVLCEVQDDDLTITATLNQGGEQV